MQIWSRFNGIDEGWASTCAGGNGLPGIFACGLSEEANFHGAELN